MNLKQHQQHTKDGRSATGRRRGSLMVEMVVCTAMLTIVSAVLVPGIYAVHQQRKATRYATLTLLELNNLAALAGRQDPETLKLSSWFTDRYGQTKLQVENVTLPGAELQTDFTPVRLTIIQTTPEEQPDVSHSLVVWLDRSDLSLEATE